uniref:von Willebrand factor A domain-containing protein 5B1-like n=1 Tax=Saccoglossus kowalevskii TaxID=10224 RepID=A0ABM0MX04_SACKO|nr:PREDICTED: von Willebrand factor A domain-containing protein 5B1-like [Saccoglossus kowalevskii]
MQSKVISSVKKALQPFISEVTIEWSLPAGLQVSQSFTETPTLMPGERLIIYGILYDTCAVTRQSEETTSAPKRSPYNEKVSSKDICSYDEVTNVNNNNVDELKPVPQVNHLDSSALVALRQKLSRDESESDKNEVEEIVDDQVQQRYFDILSRSGRALSNPETAFDSALLRKLLDSLAEEQRAKAVRKEERRAKYRERLTNNNGPRRKISDIVLAPFSSEWDNLLQGLEPSPCDSLFRFSWDEDGLLPLKEGGKEGVAVLRGLFCGRPFHCQIYFDLSSIIDGSPRSLNEEEFFDDTVHRLAAKSCIQAVESLYYQTANNEAAAKDGNTTSCDVINDCESSAKLKTKSVEISEASGVISRQTTFVTVNQETNEELPNFVQTQSINRGIQKTIFRRCSQRRSGYTAGLGRRLDASFNDTDEDVFLSTGFPDPLSNSSHPIYSGGCPLDEYVDPPSPSPTYLTKGTMFGRHFSFSTSISSTAINNDERSSSLKKKATSLLAGKLSRGRLGSVPSKKPMFKAFIPDRTLSTEMVELISLVDLQMACGAWELNYKLAEAIDIPLESLRRSSPLCYMRPPACTCGQEIQIRVEDLSEEVDSGEERESDDRGSSASTPGTLRRQQRVSEDDAHTAELVDGDIPGQSDDNPDCDLPKTTPKKINAKSRQGSREVPVTQSEKRETIALFPESGMTKRRKFSTSKDSKDSSLSMHNSSQEIPSKRPESYRFGRFSTTDEEFSEFSDVFSPTSPPDFGTPIFRIDDEETNQLWATSLALSWLEYKCSSFFEEWELIAAKADRWLSVQNLPNGFDLPSLKAAAAQVLVLLGRPKLQRQASVGQ